MTGPAVDVEQLLARVEELHGRVIRNDPTAEYLRLTLEHDEVPALLDLIRRQDAALTAVRELADELDRMGIAELDEGKATGDRPDLLTKSKRRFVYSAAIRHALASPDTTQEAGA